MKTKEGRSGISMIKPTSFYSGEREKTKLNWFCYELAMGVYDDIRKDQGKRLKKYRIDDNALAGFSIHISLRMKDIILQKLSGKISEVYFSYELVELYFPHLSDKMINKMLEVISEAWDKQLSFCEVCPIRCISERDNYCTMFDEEDLFDH